jgi:hypothetical protein
MTTLTFSVRCKRICWPRPVSQAANRNAIARLGRVNAVDIPYRE